MAIRAGVAKNPDSHILLVASRGTSYGLRPYGASHDVWGFLPYALSGTARVQPRHTVGLTREKERRLAIDVEDS
ncbi:hypothetical protein Sjap_012814 [Stephania japonica]|uniref:Uncharacterized protein n=1 Tax=Stephania japonica TaxID=461633 RepID=A0AAP0IYR0_9MAGN